jgi:hypothetical protein
MVLETCWEHPSMEIRRENWTLKMADFEVKRK